MRWPKVVLGGIYILADGDNLYTGRTNNFDRRLREHLDDVRRAVSGALARFQFIGDRNEMRLLEQYVMDFVRDVMEETFSNRRAEIARSPRSANSRRLREIFDRLDLCE